MSFHFGLGPAKSIRAAELHRWVRRSFATSCILQLIYQLRTALGGPPVRSPVAANAAPSGTVCGTRRARLGAGKGRMQLTNEEDQTPLADL